MLSTFTSAQVLGNAQARLSDLRRALEAANDFHAWLSAFTQADLETTPLSLSASDASALLSAFADAAELYTLYTGGALGTYTLPYDFSASQRQIIGPAV